MYQIFILSNVGSSEDFLVRLSVRMSWITPTGIFHIQLFDTTARLVHAREMFICRLTNHTHTYI